MNQEELKQLKKDVEELKEWKREKDRQQIKFPLDQESIDVLNDHFVRLHTEVRFLGGAAGRSFISYLGTQNSGGNSGTTPGPIPWRVEIARSNLVSYTANASADTVTTEREVFRNDDRVTIITEDTAPGGLTAGNQYWVVNANGATFQLSTTQDGSAVNITDSGTGRQYFEAFLGSIN